MSRIHAPAVLTIAMSILVLGACQSVPEKLQAEGFVMMTDPEIEQARVGNTLIGTDYGGSYAIFYPRSGEMRGQYEGEYATGKWRVSDDSYCRAWPKWGKGKETCFQLYRKGDSVNWVSRGVQTEVRTQAQGNPRDL